MIDVVQYPVSTRGSLVTLVGDCIGAVSLVVSLLASTFIGNLPVCLLAGVGFSLQVVIDRRHIGEYLTGIFAIAASMLLFTTSLFSPVALPEPEILKAAVGTLLFLLTMAFAPTSIRQLSERMPWVLHAIGAGIIIAFMLDYTGVLSLKTIGFVRWFETAGFKAQLDLRPSGIYSEPSWHALSASALAYFLAKSRSIAAKIMAILLALSSVLSGSSIGLAMACLVFLRLTVLSTRSLAGRATFIALLVLCVLIYLALPFALDIQGDSQLQKILNPTDYGSGMSRFVAPITYLRDTFTRAPLTGMGLSYITEHLIGRMGAAILPLNVFIESGLVGIGIYAFIIIALMRRSRSGGGDVMAAVLCMVSIGLQGSPFQAMLVILFIIPWGLPDTSRSAEIGII